jgi:hypothetical protein
MRLTLLAVLLAGCGGGGSSPELYALVVGFAAPPSSCSAMAPTTKVNQGPLATTQVEVWDGPEAKAYLTLVGAALNVDMGDAPRVTVAAGTALEGTNGATGWTFVTDRDTTTTGLTGAMTEVKTHVALSFPRTSTAKGTLSLSSSQTCTGTACPTVMPTCSIDNIDVRLTRLAVDYLKTP